MIISKGGIRREIDPSKLQEYKDKGYTVEAQPEANPFAKLTTAELEAKAAELEADISGCKTNAERAALLFAKTKAEA